MKFAPAVLALAALAAALGVVAVDPALARAKHRHKSIAVQRCVPNPPPPSLSDWFFGNRPHPEWNGCSPPVHVGGVFIGQDPDPNVRHTLRRDPDEGYRSSRY